MVDASLKRLFKLLQTWTYKENMFKHKTTASFTFIITSIIYILSVGRSINEREY